MSHRALMRLAAIACAAGFWAALFLALNWRI